VGLGFFLSVAVDEAAHDLSQVTRHYAAQLIEGQIVYVDVFSVEDTLKLALNRFSGETGETNHLIKEIVVAVLFYSLFFRVFSQKNSFE
jgi:hypothetical protein